MKRLSILFKTLVFIFQLQKQQNERVEKPIVYVKLTDARCGKYMFNLLAFLLLGGYKVYLFPHIRFLSSLLPYQKLLLRLSGLKISMRPPANTFIRLASHSSLQSMKGHNYQISYRYFDAPHNSIVMPYPMSPQQYLPSLELTLETLRKNTKGIGVFFSGNQNIALYNSKIIEDKFKKVTRHKLLTYLKQNMPDQHIAIIQNELSIDNRYLNKFVLVDWKWSPQIFENQNARINDTEWLTQLSYCNFFLACPGMVMPMCHNIIEAMSVGCIPITQYPEEFYPSLEHGKNCLAFSNEQEAQYQILRALEFSQEKILQMRHNVISYYEENLSPASFRNQIERDSSHTNTIVINAEQLSVYE